MVETLQEEAKLYDKETKDKFLQEMINSSSIAIETSKNYERILNLTSELENILNKDLNRFTIDELETIMYGFRAKNRNTVETYARIISSYINWSVKEGLVDDNPLSNLRPNDFSKYLTNEEEYYSDKQMKRWEGYCENYQDAVIIRLLFMGIGGRQLSEIRNLKKSDVNRKEKTIKLTNTLKYDENGNTIKYTERFVEIQDEYTFDLIEGAINQKTYTKKNGQMQMNPHVRPYTDLVSNEYVVRSSITKTDNFTNPVDKFVIYRRIQMIGEVLGIEDFTTKFIQRSGMIYYAKNIIKNGEISLDDIKMVADRFGVKSYHNLKGFLTIENILKTYPE